MTQSIEVREDLWKKIQSTRMAMIVSLDEEGQMRSRPMTVQRIDSFGTLWFFASRESTLARDIAMQTDVNVAVADVDQDLYVSIVGRATSVRDRALAEELWTPMAKAWFPGGVDDPSLVLIKVVTVSAEFWNITESKMVQFFKMAAAAVTGNPPSDLGEHGSIEGNEPIRREHSRA